MRRDTHESGSIDETETESRPGERRGAVGGADLATKWRINQPREEMTPLLPHPEASRRACHAIDFRGPRKQDRYAEGLRIVVEVIGAEVPP